MCVSVCVCVCVCVHVNDFSNMSHFAKMLGVNIACHLF